MNLPKGYWPCACVKRDKKGNLSKIKFNPPSRKRCSVCKSTRPEPILCDGCGAELDPDVFHDCPQPQTED